MFCQRAHWLMIYHVTQATVNLLVGLLLIVIVGGSVTSKSRLGAPSWLTETGHTFINTSFGVELPHTIRVTQSI